MARAQGARSVLAAAFEMTYGTAPAAGQFWQMPFASSTLGSEQPLLASELLGYGRDPQPPVKDVITADGDIVLPVDLRAWGVWLCDIALVTTKVDHRVPLIRELANAVLADLSAEFANLYTAFGRPSIAPEKLLRAMLLVIVRSDPPCHA